MLDFALMWSSLPQVLWGLRLTVTLTALILCLGVVVAIPMALAATSRRAVLRTMANGYILFFRGTPALVQIFILYYGSGQFPALRESWIWPILRDPFWCVVIALGLNSGAYVGNMLAGALRNLPSGPLEAAIALGMKPWHRLMTVHAPLVLRAVLPAYGNEAILTLKATSLASAVTLLELTGQARNLVSSTYAPYEIFLTVGAVYLLLSFALARAFAWSERRLSIPGS
jgi:His/Glu/Gln/Arg/opine family amino acid ABC transporter permease subunit